MWKRVSVMESFSERHLCVDSLVIGKICSVRKQHRRLTSPSPLPESVSQTGASQLHKSPSAAALRSSAPLARMEVSDGMLRSMAFERGRGSCSR